MTPKSYICFFVVLGFLNVWVIATNLFLFQAAIKLRDLPPDNGIIPGDQWLNKIMTWSIVAAVVSGLQTAVLVVYSIALSKFEANSQHLKRNGIAIIVVEIVFIGLAVAAIAVPRVDQWGEASLLLTNDVMYGLIGFIVAYSCFILVTMCSICRPGADNTGHIHATYQPQTYQPDQPSRHQPQNFYQHGHQYHPQSTAAATRH